MAGLPQPELLTYVYSLVAQAPAVALIAYFWYKDRQDKIKTIAHLRKENEEKSNSITEFIESMSKLSVTLELIKDRLR